MTYTRRTCGILVAGLFSVQACTAYAEPQSNAGQSAEAPSISGRVIAKGDSGIDGVKVKCIPPKNATCTPSVVSTDKDGSFFFPHVTGAEKYRLTFEHARYLHETISVEVDNAPALVAPTVMEPYIIKGAIFADGSDNGVAEASVSCVKREGPPQTECTAVTDNDGRFSIQPLQDILDPSTTYDLIITHGRFPSFRIPDIKLSDPPTYIPVHLQVPLSGRRYPVETVSGYLMYVSVLKTDSNELVVRDEDSPIRAYPGGHSGRILRYDQIRTIGPQIEDAHPTRRRVLLVLIPLIAVAAGIAIGRVSKNVTAAAP